MPYIYIVGVNADRFLDAERRRSIDPDSRGFALTNVNKTPAGVRDRRCMQKVDEKMEGKLSLVSLHGVGA